MLLSEPNVRKQFARLIDMRRMTLLVALMISSNLLAQGKTESLVGEWKRTGDEFEGMVITLKRVGDSYEGRIKSVPSEASRYNFELGDVKWRRFRQDTKSTYYFQDLFSTGSGQMQYYGAHLEVISTDEISITNISTMDLSVGLHQKWVRISRNVDAPAKEEQKPEPEPAPKPTPKPATASAESDKLRDDREAVDYSWVLNIRFRPNSDKLIPSSLGPLNELTDFMKQHPGLVIRVEGHTDRTEPGGDPAFNMELSERRAKAVREYLVSSDIGKDRIEAKGFGDTSLMVERYDPRNRRVVIRVLKADPRP